MGVLTLASVGDGVQTGMGQAGYRRAVAAGVRSAQRDMRLVVLRRISKVHTEICVGGKTEKRPCFFFEKKKTRPRETASLTPIWCSCCGDQNQLFCSD